jgi:hypothetical protein
MEEQKSEELKILMEKLSQALSGVIQESTQVRSLLRKIEEGGYDANLTLAVVLGLKDKSTEIHQIVYGPENSKSKKSTARRISAFDRRFLRALRIRLPD